MPITQMVEVAIIIPPDQPMRAESLYAGLDELKESLDKHGLQQPIGVQRTQDGYLKLIWGMRRTLAARELGWHTLEAKVYDVEEAISPDELMAHENFHREQLNAYEEACFYRSQCDKWQVSPEEIARRMRRSGTHVRELLALLDGDPAVLEDVRIGKLNRAQAKEINKIRDEVGRTYMLRYARDGGLSAEFIRRWREQREISGSDVNMVELAQEIAANPQAELKTSAKCYACNSWHDIVVMKLVNICDGCWSNIGEALEVYQKWLSVQGRAPTGEQEPPEGGGHAE